VILAVKPQGLSAFLDQAASLFRPRQLLITILAGVPARVLRKRIRARIRIVRAMPNTPALVGAGITAMAGRSRRDLAAAAAVFSKLGRVVVVREAMMNAVTAVSGAGPAYVYRFTEALAEAGRRQGFSAGLARTLAEETLKGAAALLAATGEMSGVLRARVTSPGGVTEAALKKMAALGFEKTLIRGVAAGVRRGRELSP
jgi:pyrroline-5-carboxylate reductase